MVVDELHSSGTLEGRLEASRQIRNFAWSLAGFEKGRRDDYNRLFNLFVDNLASSVRSFCSFSEVARFKECTVDELHNVYTTSRIRFFSFTCNFDKLLYRKAITQCQECVEQDNRTDENGDPGRLVCRNIIEFPPFLFLCNGNNLNYEAPSTLQIEGYIYMLHGRVYVINSQGGHFNSIGIVERSQAIQTISCEVRQSFKRH